MPARSYGKRHKEVIRNSLRSYKYVGFEIGDREELKGKSPEFPNCSASPIIRAMPNSRAPLIRFDVFEMDVESGELRRSGTRVKLPHQPFRVLELLISRPGVVWTRPEIEREVWGVETFVDFESGLNYCIKQIRAALKDDANAPRYVETLPRRGYRFIAAVERQDRESTRVHTRPMLAVIPFGNLTGAADDYFTEGLTEELIAQIARLNPAQLGVIAFTTARQYRNTDKGIGQIGRELGVDYIIEGSARRSGDRARIMVQLIQVSDQSHLWAEAYNRTLEDMIGIQIDVAERVAQSLTVNLLAKNIDAMERTSTRNSGAYEDYLKGRYYFNRRTDDDFSKARRYFEEAIRKDPNYVLAYVGLADVYAVMGLYSGLSPAMAYQEVSRLLQKALSLDETLAETQAAAGYAKLLYDWDFKGADRSFRRALTLNPNYVTGRYQYALFLAATGDFDKALEHIDSAIQLDPLSLVINSNKGWILYMARRHETAIAQLRNTLEMEQDFALARYFLGLVYLQLARYTEAAAEFQKAKKASENHPASISGLAVAAALGGKPSQARKGLQALENLQTQRYVTPYYSALIHAALGDKYQALLCLKRACEDRSAFLTNMKNDPALDPLRKDLRFVRLMKRAGLG